MTDEELKYAIENGIINISQISDAVNAMKREEILKNYPYKIWQGNDGRWYSYIVENGKKIKIAKTEKDKLIDQIVTHTKAEEENPTLYEIFKEWNDYRLRAKVITESSHLRMEQTFNRHFDDKLKKRRIRTMKQLDFVLFLEEELVDKDLPSKSFASLKTVVKGIIKRARRSGYIDYTANAVIEDLDTTIHKFRRNKGDISKEVYYDEELEVILKYLVFNQDSYNLAILVMFITGMRIGEVAALKNDAIDLTHGCFIVKRTETKKSNGKHVEIYVHDLTKTDAGMRMVVVPIQYRWLLDKLYKLSVNQEYVFMREDGDTKERIISQGFRRRLHRICKQFEIPYRSPHKIRKTYDSILLDNGMDQRFILDQMGHVDMSMNEERYHRNRRHMDTKAEMLGALNEFKISVG